MKARTTAERLERAFERLRTIEKRPSNALRTHSNTLSTHTPHTPLPLPRAEEGVGTPSRTRKRARETVVGGTAAIVRATDADRARARALLTRITPLASWMAREKPSPCRARLALLVVRETMKVAGLSPAEKSDVAAKLEISEATTMLEKVNVAA